MQAQTELLGWVQATHKQKGGYDRPRVPTEHSDYLQWTFSWILATRFANILGDRLVATGGNTIWLVGVVRLGGPRDYERR
jgi:hypothetical protein